MLDNIIISLDNIMAKQSGTGGERRQSAVREDRTSGEWAVRRDAGTGRIAAARATQVEAVMAAAERSGLLREKSGRIGGRVSPALVRKAKDKTGIEADTDLINFALASVALEDRFAEAFKAVHGTVDPDLELGW